MRRETDGGGPRSSAGLARPRSRGCWYPRLRGIRSADTPQDRGLAHPGRSRAAVRAALCRSRRLFQCRRPAAPRRAGRASPRDRLCGELQPRDPRRALVPRRSIPRSGRARGAATSILDHRGRAAGNGRLHPVADRQRAGGGPSVARLRKIRDRVVGLVPETSGRARIRLDLDLDRSRAVAGGSPRGGCTAAPRERRRVAHSAR